MEKSTYTQNLNYFIDKINQMYDSDLSLADDSVIEKYLEGLDRLGIKFPEESQNDSLYHLLYIRILTRDYTRFNKYKNVFKSRHYSALYPTKKKKLTKTDRTFTPVNNLAEQYATSTEQFVNKTIAKKRRKKFLIGFVCGAVILAAAMPFAMPNVFFPVNYIKYVIDGQEYSKEIHFSQGIQLDIPKKTGYEFEGLFDGEGADAKMVVDKNGKGLQRWGKMEQNYVLELYPHFTPIVYNVTLAIEDFTYSGKISYDVTYDTVLPDFDTTSISRTGYTFLGYKSSKGKQVLNQELKNESSLVLNEKNFDIPEDNTTPITLEAISSANTYSVSFDVNGANGSSLDPVTVTYDSQVTLPVVTKDNVKFVGWFDGDVAVSDSDGVVEKWTYDRDITLVAKWDAGDTTHYLDGFGTKELPYRIANPTHFKNIVRNPSAYYVLTNDVDLGSEYIPICGRSWAHSRSDDNPADAFQGHLNGNNYMISYETTMRGFDNDYDYAYGLFGSIVYATVENLKIKSIVDSPNIDVEAVNGRECCTGGLAGLSINSLVRDVEVVSGSTIRNYDTDCTWYVFAVGMQKTGATYAGGLIGDARSTTFENVTVSANVYGRGYICHCGGVVGNYYNSTGKSTMEFVSGDLSSSHFNWIWGEDTSGILYAKETAPWYRLDGTTYTD